MERLPELSCIKMSLGQNSDHELFLTVQVFFETIEKQLTYTTSLRDNNYK